MMTVKDIQDCFKRTLAAKATPHREPDFKKIIRAVGANAVVQGRLWFIEDCNTGYDGVLERWQFKAISGDEEVSFWADLIPGLILMAPKPAVN